MLLLYIVADIFLEGQRRENFFNHVPIIGFYRKYKKGFKHFLTINFLQVYFYT